MLAKMPHEGSLVLYKGRPARVQRVGEKVDLQLPEGETAHVRQKDVTLLHPGPLTDLTSLAARVHGHPGRAPKFLSRYRRQCRRG